MKKGSISLDEYMKATKRLEKMLLEANELLRSAYAIAQRNGEQTNWEAFRGQLQKALQTQLESGLTSRALDGATEFERLLEYARQALSGVVIEKREVIGFAGLAVLEDVVKDYENRLTQRALDGCSYSPDKVHHFDGDTVQICSYCTIRRQ